MSEFGEPWRVIDTPEKCWIHDAKDRYIAGCKFPVESMKPFAEREENAGRIVACVNSLAGVPTELVTDPNFRIMLHTLAQHALADDKSGQEQSGWVLGQMMKRAFARKESA